MKNTLSTDKLSSTDGKTNFASRVKGLLSSSPLVRKRSLSTSGIMKPTTGSSKVFGIPLGVLVAREGGEVPFIIRRIVEYVEQNGMETEGIYRVNGNAKNIEKMKISFERIGDAKFPGEDISAIAGLLKLFLRELPEGIVSIEKVPEFVRVQVAHPHKATPEALSKLRHVIHTLPPAHYATLKYLIRHLAKVAEHTDSNKMTPVSLSIVFGPNIFHCGEGLEALQLQGYSNSTVCRMVLYHEVLFEGVEEVKVRRRSSPARPRPYSEHLAGKSVRHDGPHSPIRSSLVDSTSDLERSYSEKSIDEAIQERSSGTLSPTSPAHLQEPTSPKTPPPRPPPPRFGKSASKEAAPAVSSPNENKQSNEDEEDSPFRRQYAKRGRKFNFQSSVEGQRSEDEEIKVRSPVKGQGSPSLSSSSKSSEVLKHTQVNALGSREDEGLLRAPSPASFMSSPGGSPPTSPVITPRSSRAVSTVIDQSINQYLFQPPSSSSTSSEHSQTKAPKADVYGLLLPEKSSNQNEPPTTKHKQPPVVRRLSLQEEKKRNRKSSLFGDNSDSQEREEGPIEDMNVQILSVSPENSMVSRQGRLSELVSRFEDGVGSDSVDGVDGGAGDDVRGGGVTSEGGVPKKRKPSNKAFEMFEKKGLVIGMAGPSVPKVSFASTNTTISPSPSPTTSPAHQLSPSHLQTGTSEDLTTVSKLLSTSTNGDEDVFSSPVHLTTHTPSTRDTLSTTTSDDVFISPAHTGSGHGQSTGPASNQDMDDIKREQMLDHAVLSRPKGPANRRQPSRTRSTPTLSSAEKAARNSSAAHKNDQSNRSKDATPKPILSPVTETDGSQTSVAPEDQPRVERGWRESVGGVEEVDGVETRPSEQAHQVKEITHKIHVIKKQVKEFETQFISSHGHKPVGEEKAPVRHLIEEAHKLKKQLKNIEGSPNHEDQQRESVSPPRDTVTSEPPTTLDKSANDTKQPITIDTGLETVNLKLSESQTRSTAETEDGPVNFQISRRATFSSKAERETGDQTKVSNEPRVVTLSRNAKSLGDVLPPGRGAPDQSRLVGTLNKLMGSLKTRRSSSGRPDDLYIMKSEQLLQEKRDIQKALLQFEKAHGRPTNREDKETMRPLYDRYREVKKLASSTGEEPRIKRSQTLSRQSLGALESTNDSLPSVTLLHSTTLGPSLPGAFPSTSSHEASPRESSALLKGKDPDKKIKVLSDSELKKANLDELLGQNKLLLEVKKEIRTTLKEFERKFQAEHGRGVGKEDRGQMRDEYDRYKDVKTKLKIVSSLMTKTNPQKTI